MDVEIARKTTKITFFRFATRRIPKDLGIVLRLFAIIRAQYIKVSALYKFLNLLYFFITIGLFSISNELKCLFVASIF